MRIVKGSVFGLTLLMIVSSVLSTATAQSTTITNLVYPTGSVTNETAQVTFDLTYSGLTSTDVLVAFIYDTAVNNIANGAAFSSPNQCIPLAGTRFGDDAACVWRPDLSSGTQHLTFTIQFSGTHIQTYDFSAAAGVYTYTGVGTASVLSFSTQSFAITAGTTYQLTISTTYPVTVSVDGSSTASGLVDVTPGFHRISIPSIVQLDNVSRLTFEHWDDGTTETNRTLNIHTDTTIDATYVRQYLLTLISSPVKAAGAGWYDDGASAQYSVPKFELMQNFLAIIGGKIVFNGWYENGKLVTAANTGEITVLDAHTLTAQWTTNYTIPIEILGVVAAVIAGSVTFLVVRASSKKKKR